MCASDVFKIANGALTVYSGSQAQGWADAVIAELKQDFGQMWHFIDKPREQDATGMAGRKSGPINLEWVKRVLNGNGVRMINDAILHDKGAGFNRWALHYLKCTIPEVVGDESTFTQARYFGGWIDGIPPPPMQIPAEFDPRGGVATPPPETIAALLRTLAIAENWNGQFSYDTITGSSSWPVFGEDELLQLRGESRSASKWNYYILMGHLYPTTLIDSMEELDEGITPADGEIIQAVFTRGQPD